MFSSSETMMTDVDVADEDVKYIAKSSLSNTNSFKPLSRKRSLCFGEIVSPSIELADNLEDLTTSSRKSWKFKDMNRVRRKLSLSSSSSSPPPPSSSCHSSNIFHVGKKLSVDDGCFLESPSNSSPVSISSKYNDGLRRNNALFDRNSSEPNYHHNTKTRSSSVCLFPDVLQSGGGRRNSDDNKENESIKSSQCSSFVSCFKSPSSTPKLKKVALQNQSNNPPTHVKLNRCTSSISTKHRKSMKREESIDDGFIEQLSKVSTIPTSSKHELPTNFQKLLFSPLIECHELETSNVVHNNNIIIINDDNSTDYDRNKNIVERDVPTYSQSSSSSPPCFASPKSSRPLFFSMPTSIGYRSGMSANFFCPKTVGGQEVDMSRMTWSKKGNRLMMSSMSCVERCQVKRSESVDEQELSFNPNECKKRRRRRNRINEEGKNHFCSFPMLTKCHSEAELSIKSALNLDDIHQDLIGDFSRKYSLPLIDGKHQDLRTISIKTMASLLRNEYCHVVDGFKIVDCRYPYEFDGGHIKGAINIHSGSDLVREFFYKFLEKSSMSSNESQANSVDSGHGVPLTIERNILIFHCEFSSERGPKLSRLLRNTDRERNSDSYPSLHYPELYILNGGYKAFFDVHPDLCEPMGYVPMLDPDHTAHLRLFRKRSCSLLLSKSMSKLLFSDCR